jgi:hypothetical protein
MHCNWGNKEVELTVTQKPAHKSDKIIGECDYPLCVKKHDNECPCNRLTDTKTYKI